MFRIAKRKEIGKRKKTMIKISSIFLALLVMSVFIIAIGHNPLYVYKAMLDGCFGSSYRFKETLILTIPLSLTAIGVTIAFRLKFWNIGGEGQIFMGAFAASYFALNFSHLPKMVLIPVMFIAGAVGGGIWALIPAFFKVKYDTNETLFTLMMNYIGMKFIIYLQYGPWKDPKALGFPKIPNFEDSALLPKVMGVHLGFIIMIIMTILFFVYINKTKAGYEIRVVGESQNTARYAGMNVEKVILKSLFISGAVCGIVGMIQSSGVSGTLSVEVSGGVGYTAIIVAWLSGMNILLIPVVGFLFAVLTQGGSYIQTAFQISQSAALILQGMILIFALGSEFFVNYSIHKVTVNKETDKKIERRCA